MDDGEYRNWAELPPDLLSLILVRLGMIDILENAQKVCKSWHRVCKDPWMWQKIDTDNWEGSFKYDLESMCRHAVDRSQGGLVEIDICYFNANELLSYIANRSSNLRVLRLIEAAVTERIFFETVVKLPLLEHIEITNYYYSSESLRVAGQSCPNLRTLKLKSRYGPHSQWYVFRKDYVALAIAQSMPQLRHLQLFGNSLTNVGLNAILDGCPHLEHLDLSICLNVDLTRDLEKRCIERIKVLKRPNNPTVGDPSLYYFFP